MKEKNVLAWVTNGSASGLKFFKIILFQHGTTALQSPAYRFSDGEDCYILVVLLFYRFPGHRRRL